MLYVWSVVGSNELLLNHRYAGYEDYANGDAYPIGSANLDETGGQLRPLIRVARQYDRGNCSAFLDWVSFRDQLVAQFDAAVSAAAAGSGAESFPIGNSEFTPLLAINSNGHTYEAGSFALDTNDSFRFTREYQLKQGPGSEFRVFTFQGQFTTAPRGGLPTGNVSFRLLAISVHDIDGTPDAGLTSAFQTAIPAALNTALNDQLFTSGPASLRAVATCRPSNPNADSQCLTLLNGLFRIPSISPNLIVLRQDQVRCHADTPQGTTGHCQFKPLVARTQEYP
jgi:hypothetical protein